MGLFIPASGFHAPSCLHGTSFVRIIQPVVIHKTNALEAPWYEHLLTIGSVGGSDPIILKFYKTKIIAVQNCADRQTDKTIKTYYSKKRRSITIMVALRQFGEFRNSSNFVPSVVEEVEPLTTNLRLGLNFLCKVSTFCFYRIVSSAVPAE